MGSTDEATEGSPWYARALRLRHIHPGALACFLLFEGSIVVSALLALAELTSWLAVLVLPLAVAGMVKINDLVAGATAVTVARPALAGGGAFAGTATLRGGRLNRRVPSGGRAVTGAGRESAGEPADGGYTEGGYPDGGYTDGDGGGPGWGADPAGAGTACPVDTGGPEVGQGRHAAEAPPSGRDDPPTNRRDQYPDTRRDDGYSDDGYSDDTRYRGYRDEAGYRDRERDREYGALDNTGDCDGYRTDRIDDVGDQERWPPPGAVYRSRFSDDWVGDDRVAHDDPTVSGGARHWREADESAQRAGDAARPPITPRGNGSPNGLPAGSAFGEYGARHQGGLNQGRF